MENTTNPWQERFTWSWICEDEILRYTQEDFDQRARDLHERGITAAIDFSLTHFRFGYYTYWDKIHEAFRKFVTACHQYGIKVIEHHSASLVHNLLSQAGWQRFETDLGSYSNWKAKVKTWVEVPRFLACDPKVDGLPLEEMFQIDGRTGEIADTVYHCHAFCYNNPNYRKVYFQYMRDLLAAVPFDGIMNDDVQYFGDGNACTCPHCRKKFKEKYGYDIPQPSEWESFYGDYSNPAYVAWERFKRESTEEIYRDLGKLYEELGVKLLRPNYTSSCLLHNSTPYGFDRCCDVWDFIFQENCFSAVMKYSYVDFMAEAIHRFAAGDQHGVPSMSMFYPDREDTVYFGWALATTWGQLYTGTSEGVDTTAIEKRYRDFESNHSGALIAPKKIEDLAFYFSMQTRDYTEGAMKRYMEPFVGSMQAACLSGLGVGMAFEPNSVDELCKHPAIVASHVALMTDEELSRFREYVSRGNTLILMGEFASFDGENRARNTDDALSALGVSVKAEPIQTSGDVRVTISGKEIVMRGMNAIYALSGATSIAALEDGTCVGIEASVGDGRVVWLAANPGEEEMQQSIWADRRQPIPAREMAQPSRRSYQLAHSGAFLNLAVGARKLRVSCGEEELLATAFRVENGVSIHLVNLSDTIPQEAVMVGHDDILTHFAKGAKKLPAIQAELRIDTPVKRVTLYTPETDAALPLAFTQENGVVALSVPENAFAGYALIALEQ